MTFGRGNHPPNERYLVPMNVPHRSLGYINSLSLSLSLDDDDGDDDD